MKKNNFIKKLKSVISESENKNKQLNESAYPRVANILRGVVPSINTVGLITAENPYGKLSKKANNEDLIKDLKRMNFGFIKVVGQYGNKENSLLVPNIEYDKLLELGEKYNQESVIFGEKISETKDGKEYTGMEFKMIYTDENFGKVISKRNVFINDNDMDDYYSVIKGRKFYIPFFDDEYDDAKFDKNSGMIQKDGLNEDTINTLQSISNKIFDKTRTNKSKWLNRGVLKNKLNELKGTLNEVKYIDGDVDNKRFNIDDVNILQRGLNKLNTPSVLINLVPKLLQKKSADLGNVKSEEIELPIEKTGPVNLMFKSLSVSMSISKYGNENESNYEVIIVYDYIQYDGKFNDVKITINIDDNANVEIFN